MSCMSTTCRRRLRDALIASAVIVLLAATGLLPDVAHALGLVAS